MRCVHAAQLGQQFAGRRRRAGSGRCVHGEIRASHHCEVALPTVQGLACSLLGGGGSRERRRRLSPPPRCVAVGNYGGHMGVVRVRWDSAGGIWTGCPWLLADDQDGGRCAGAPVCRCRSAAESPHSRPSSPAALHRPRGTVAPPSPCAPPSLGPSLVWSLPHGTPETGEWWRCGPCACCPIRQLH